jgi:hypothetical protein
MNIPISNLTILDAIQFTVDAWNHVEATTIASSWKKTGIIPPMPDSNDEFLNLPLDTKEDEAVQYLINHLHLPNPLSAREYLRIDSMLRTEDMLDDDMIISLVQGEEAIENEEENLETVTPIITSTDAVELIDKLTCFLMHEEAHVHVSDKFLSELKNVKKTLCRVIIDSKVQTDISSFLEPID